MRGLICLPNKSDNIQPVLGGAESTQERTNTGPVLWKRQGRINVPAAGNVCQACDGDPGSG